MVTPVSFLVIYFQCRHCGLVCSCRVGMAFENTKKETGETFLSLKLDFPVGVTELVAFQPKPQDDEENDNQE